MPCICKSLFYFLSHWRELNSWPLPYQGSALPLSYNGFYLAKNEREEHIASVRNFSSFFLLSGRRGSNPPPIAWKAIALPNELLPLVYFLWGRVDSNHRTLPRTDLQSVAIAAMRLPHAVPCGTCEPMEGFEPPTPRLQITCSGQLSYIGIFILSNNSSCLSVCKSTTNFQTCKLFLHFFLIFFFKQ